MAKVKLAKPVAGVIPRKPGFDALHRKILSDFQRSRESRYRIGAMLVVMRDLELYRDGGYSRFNDYLASLKTTSLRSCQRYMELARKVSLEVALAFDPERLEAGLRLLPAKEATVITVKSLTAIKVPVERNGRVRTVSFNDATTDELIAAVVDLEKAARPALTAEVTGLKDRVAKRLGSGAGAIGDVGLRRRGKKLVLVIEVPVERGDELLSRLR